MDGTSRFLIEDLKDEETVAKELGIGRGALLAARENGCPFVRLGKKVFYVQQDLTAWVREHCSGTVGSPRN